MGKFFKFGCLGVILIVVLLIVVVMFSGGEENVSTGTDSTASNTEEKSKEAGTKTIDASSQTIEVAGMKVGLGEIKISKNKVEVGINIENTSNNMLMFYPDQGSAVIGDMQLDANFFLTDGDIGGEVQSGIKQDAVLEFLTPEGKEIDVNSLKEIKFLFGDVVTEDFMTSEPANITVPVQ